MADCMCELKLVDFLNDVAWYYVITYCAFRVQGTIWSYPRSLSHDLTSYTSHVWILTPSPSKNLFSAGHNLSPPMLKVFVGRDGYRNWQVYLVRGAVDEGKVGILGGICVGPMKNQKSPAINSMHHGTWTCWPQRHGGLVQMMFLVQLGWSGDLSRFIFRDTYRWTSSVKPHGFIESFDGREDKGNLTMAENMVVAWHPWSFETTREKKGEKKNIYIYIWVSLTKHTKISCPTRVLDAQKKTAKQLFQFQRLGSFQTGPPVFVFSSACLRFRVYDTDGSGDIDNHEMAKLVQERWIQDIKRMPGLIPKNTSGMSQERPVFVGERG